MKVMMKNDNFGIDAENFVIRLFDAIKCADATNTNLRIELNREEVKDLSEHIKAVNWIEINEEGEI